MAANSTFIRVDDLFDTSTLVKSLNNLGQYVYGYYEPDKIEPFYVGKGRGNRVLSHWNNTCANIDNHEQYGVIKKILQSGNFRTVKILAYNLENTKRNDVYSVVERVLQNTFGIDKPDSRIFASRISQMKIATLKQDRNDGKKHPILSLEAAYCKGAFNKFNMLDPNEIASMLGVPVLLVGLSKSYHPNYSQDDLSQMARMYWSLDRLKRFQSLKNSPSSVLVGWTSTFGGPQIAGIWRIQENSFAIGKQGNTKRYECIVVNDFALRRKFLGCRLIGSGNSYFGPHIYIHGYS